VSHTRPAFRRPVRPTCTAAVLLVACCVATAEQTISADLCRDKLQGMWLGQLMGNYAGRPREGWIQRGGLDYTVDWLSATGGTLWDGDDDTCFELLYSDVLNASADPNSAQVGLEWVDHISPNSFYIANLQARWLMDQGVTPPETGGQGRNMHWYAIDSQITTESLGAVSAGMRQRAAELVGEFAAVSNSGFPVHAAQFYGAMYAAAFFEPNVENLVTTGLAVVPTTSRTHQVIDDVLTWYRLDKADGTLNWRDTQAMVYDKYYGTVSKGRGYNWVESTVNTGMTTLAVLYGQGDFTSTVEIGVQAGFDADCNPATAGGLIGLVQGYSGLPSDLAGSCATNYEASSWLRNMDRTRTVGEIVDSLQSAAEGQILLCGGSISGSGSSRTYHLVDDVVASPAEKPDPTGPKGLVGIIQAMGGTVSVSASVESHDPNRDQYNLDAIIDGITDVGYNGYRAYSTYDGTNAQPAGGDFYQLNFDRKTQLRKVIFYEGEYAWGYINGFPSSDAAKGGFFTDLIVEVGSGGTWTAVSNLQFSEALDRCEFYQAIELTFDPADGDAVRIRGTAGGTDEFTTILELEAYGAIYQPGDANLDGVVGTGDLALMASSWLAAGKTWGDGDFNGDGLVGTGDLALMASNWPWSAPAPAPPAPLPEPTVALVLAAWLIPLSRKRRTDNPQAATA